MQRSVRIAPRALRLLTIETYTLLLPKISTISSAIIRKYEKERITINCLPCIFLAHLLPSKHQISPFSGAYRVGTGASMPLAKGDRRHCPCWAAHECPFAQSRLAKGPRAELPGTRPEGSRSHREREMIRSGTPASDQHRS